MKKILALLRNGKEIALLKEFCDEMKCELIIADGVPNARSLFQDSPPDVIVSGAITHGGNACDFCKFVRSTIAGRDVPIIITSPIVTGSLALETKTKWGADEFIALPVPVRTFKNMLKFYLGAADQKPKADTILKMAVNRARAPQTTTIHKARKKIPSAGDLANVDFERLLLVMGAASRTGGLIVGATQDSFNLTVRNGRLVQVSTAYIPELCLEAILVNRKYLSADALRPLKRRLEQEKAMMGQMLMEAGLLKKDQISKALSYQYIEKVLTLFSKKAGPYKFSNKYNEPPGDFKIEIPIGRLILEKNRRLLSKSEFEKIYNERMQFSPRLKEGGAFHVQDLQLEGGLKRFAVTLNGNKTLYELINQAEVEASELIALIHTLFQLKMVKPARSN